MSDSAVSSRESLDSLYTQAWEMYSRWEDQWATDHPDDDRDTLGLIEEFGKLSEGELCAFFEGVEKAKGVPHA